MRCTETKRITASYARIVESVLQAQVALIPVKHRANVLCILQSEADELCILDVYLKNYTLAVMPLCLQVLGLISITTCVNM